MNMKKKDKQDPSFATCVDFLDFYLKAGGHLRKVPKPSKKTEEAIQQCRSAAFLCAREFVRAKTEKERSILFVRAVTVVIELNKMLARVIDTPDLAERVERAEKIAEEKSAKN